MSLISLAKAFLDIGVNHGPVKPALDQVKNQFRGAMGGIQGDIGGGMKAAIGQVLPGLIGLASGAGLVAGAFKAIASAREAVFGEKRLAMMIESTGEACGYTTTQLLDMAAAYQKVTSFSDDAIISAMGTLAAFENLSGKNFARTLKASMDIASFKGGDPGGYATMLGNAMDNPEEMAGMKRRLKGIVSGDEIKQVKFIAETGDIERAQDLFLSFIEKRIPQASEKLADPWKIMKNSIDDAVENIGKQMLPYVNDVAQAVSKVVDHWKEAGIAALEANKKGAGGGGKWSDKGPIDEGGATGWLALMADLGGLVAIAFEKLQTATSYLVGGFFSMMGYFEQFGEWVKSWFSDAPEDTSAREYAKEYWASLEDLAKEKEQKKQDELQKAAKQKQDEAAKQAAEAAKKQEQAAKDAATKKTESEIARERVANEGSKMARTIHKTEKSFEDQDLSPYEKDQAMKAAMHKTAGELIDAYMKEIENLEKNGGSVEDLSDAQDNLARSMRQFAESLPNLKLSEEFAPMKSAFEKLRQVANAGLLSGEDKKRFDAMQGKYGHLMDTRAEDQAREATAAGKLGAAAKQELMAKEHAIAAEQMELARAGMATGKNRVEAEQQYAAALKKWQDTMAPLSMKEKFGQMSDIYGKLRGAGDNLGPGGQLVKQRMEKEYAEVLPDVRAENEAKNQAKDFYGEMGGDTALLEAKNKLADLQDKNKVPKSSQMGLMEYAKSIQSGGLNKEAERMQRALEVANKPMIDKQALAVSALEAIRDKMGVGGGLE